MGDPVLWRDELDRERDQIRDDRIALQKHLEGQIANLRAEFQQQMKLDRRALKLNAKEIKRRLRELNGHHAEAEATLARTVQQDVFAAFQKSEAVAKELAQKEFQDWKDNVNKAITQTESANKAAITQAQASNRMWMAAISIILTLLGFALRFIGPT